MKKLLKIDKFLRHEPRDDPKWVRTVHAVRAAMREDELTSGGKSAGNDAVRKILEEHRLKANFIYV